MTPLWSCPPDPSGLFLGLAAGLLVGLTIGLIVGFRCIGYKIRGQPWAHSGEHPIDGPSGGL